ARAPVVFGRPVAGELLRRRQLHTLGPIGDEFLGRPASRIDAAAQFFDLALRNFDSERADPGLRARGRAVAHDRVLPVASLVSCRSCNVATWKRISIGDLSADALRTREAICVAL